MTLHKIGTLLAPLFIAAFVYGSTGCVANAVDSTGSDSTRSDAGEAGLAAPLATSATILKGTAVYPDGSPVLNQPVNVVITTQGKGTPKCLYDDQSVTNGTDQALSGTQTTSFSFDGSGDFQFQSNSEDGKWDLNPGCSPGHNYYNLNNTSIVFDAIDVISISATLATNAGNCAEYCTAGGGAQACSGSQGDPASVAACKAAASYTPSSSCLTQCTSAKSIIASAESLGSDATIDSATGFPVLSFSLKFNGLQ